MNRRSSHFAVALTLSFAFFSVFSGGDNSGAILSADHGSEHVLDRVEIFQSRQRRDVGTNSSSSQNATEYGDHKYYTSHYLENGQSMWSELEGHQESIRHWNLTNGTIKYSNIQLKFKFPYYGHRVDNIAVTTEGFLYLGWVATRFDIMRRVMYLAPLMAFFNPVTNGSAAIYYLSNASQFTVQWTNIYLDNDTSAGPFTFQCSLYNDGRITFVYKSLPKKASEIKGVDLHAVRVGLSDAFTLYHYSHYQGHLVLVRVFYRYHELALNQSLVKTGSAFLIQPKPNCISATSCDDCREVSQNSDFSCKWCKRIKRCSDSVDRHRLKWFLSSCNKDAVMTKEQCAGISPTGRNHPTTAATPSAKHFVVVAGDNQSSAVGAGAIVGICLAVLVIVAVSAWCFFAYTHPTSRSGLFLISLRYKPRELFTGGKSSGGGGEVESTAKSSSLA